MIACGMLVKNEEDIIEHSIKYYFIVQNIIINIYGIIFKWMKFGQK